MPARIAPADNVTHPLCGEPLPIVFFYPPNRKQMGRTACCLAEVLITIPCPYEQQLQTIGPLLDSPSLVCSADITCSRGAIDTSTCSSHETQLRPRGQRRCAEKLPPCFRVCIKAHCAPTLKAITLTILKQTAAFTLQISV